jgi:hypothetical protein
MKTEWGIKKFLTTADVKLQLAMFDQNGDPYTVGNRPDFVVKLWVLNRRTTVFTASKAGETYSGCYLGEDNQIYVNIPKNTFTPGRLCIAFEPTIVDGTFNDGTYEPSVGSITDYEYISI